METPAQKQAPVELKAMFEENAKPAQPIRMGVNSPVELALCNAQLRQIDEALKASGIPPMKQMGVLFIACALGFRRMLEEHKITDRGRRMKLLKLAAEQLMDKIKEYGMPNSEAPEL